MKREVKVSKKERRYLKENSVDIKATYLSPSETYNTTEMWERLIYDLGRYKRIDAN